MNTNNLRGEESTASRRSESIDAQISTVTVHVVCRECPFEALIDAGTRTAAVEQAKEAQLRHAIDAGHTATARSVVDDLSCHICGRIPLLTTVTGPDATDATHDCGHTAVEAQR
jgi:hypothetical protein